jgi:Fungal specific transcription factor domain
VVALVTFLGLHAQSNSASYTPTASSECKRRLFCQIFTVDKVVASFTGRPPLISGRYASTPLPLDLRDDVLLRDAASIKRAVDGLDANGWNTNSDGVLCSATIVRAEYSLACIRDEIFGIALGHQHTSVKTIQ